MADGRSRPAALELHRLQRDTRAAGGQRPHRPPWRSHGLRHPSRGVRRTLTAIGVDGILDLTDAGDADRPPSGRAPQPPSALSLVPDLEPTAGPTLMDITNAVVSACKAHTGKGPMRAKAHLRSNALSVVLRDWMTVAESTLVAGGRKDLVAESRRHLHQRVADATRSSVEEATGRNVTGPAATSTSTATPRSSSSPFAQRRSCDRHGSRVGPPDDPRPGSRAAWDRCRHRRQRGRGPGRGPRSRLPRTRAISDAPTSPRTTGR